MKSVIASILFIFISWAGIAQHLIIGHPGLGGHSTAFQPVQLSAPTYGSTGFCEHYVDLDKDSLHDIQFVLHNNFNGQIGQYEIKIATYGHFKVHIDTNYIDTVQYTIAGQVRDTIYKEGIVQKYKQGDGVYANHPIDSFFRRMHYHAKHTMNSVIIHNVNPFLNDTAYIAFTKTTDTSQFVYCIKVYVPSHSELHLLSAIQTDDLWRMPPSDELLIYPNPAYDIIYFRPGYSKLHLFNLQGKLMHSINIPIEQQSLKVAGLKTGYYIIGLEKDGKTDFGQFLKF